MFADMGRCLITLCNRHYNYCACIGNVQECIRMYSTFACSLSSPPPPPPPSLSLSLSLFLPLPSPSVIHPAQVVRQVLHVVSGHMLNDLLLRKDMCHWTKGIQIRSVGWCTPNAVITDNCGPNYLGPLLLSQF